MKPKSETLFHFTKSSDVLEVILEDGFWPRFCLEDVSWLGFTEYDYVSYPMVCFCDIPLSRISEHVDFYGSFGLGMSKDWAEKNGLNPVFYFSRSSATSKTLRKLNNPIIKLSDEDDVKKAQNTIRYIYAFTKPTKGEMVVDNQPVGKNFYQESEWSYVPTDIKITHLTRVNHENVIKLQKANEATKKSSLLKFTPNDIKYIFVKQDSDIPRIVNFIQSKMDKYPASDIKILLSRIVSLESLSADI